ncbi:MAG: [protein-PII] uridylyltransferase [Planctomycetales bacterium]|nr:[protein-PII] uridylyltransferase [Planctomycetales bacterium]
MVEAPARDSTATLHQTPELEARASRIAIYKTRLNVIRDLVRKRFEQGATGAQTSGYQSELFDEFVVWVLTEALNKLEPSLRALIESQSGLLAVGGTGRGELCPHSDLDLLFLSTPAIAEQFDSFTGQVKRDLWDSGLSLGASVRTISDSIRWAKQDPKFATSLVDVRPLWGVASLGEQLVAQFQRSVKSRARQFIAEAVTARDTERAEQSTTTQQLEPDVKRSLGALRDLHLIRWVGFATHGTGNLDSLRLHGAINKDDSRRLLHAHEFLTSLRINLHLSADKEQDVLSRDDQLRISRERKIEPLAGQAPVERFMQEYFQHSTAVASIARRFVASTQSASWTDRLVQYLTAYRIDDIYHVGRETLDVPRKHRPAVCGSLEGVLKLFLTAVRCRVRVAPALLELIRTQQLQAPGQLSAEASQSFLALLKNSGTLGQALRDLHDTGVMEAVLPCWGHIRCLLQFNQYHHFTVDEHTLRAIEAAEGFAADDGPLGQAYREIHHKELLHLALLLHDAGKGFEEDHSEVGRRLAHDAALRLGLPDHQRELVMMLVHRHLQMADLALRRDIGDRAILLKFSHDVGSADALRMLFVLTAADISAVGPGTWNHWKAELTTTLYDRTMLWLSGKSHLFDEATRLQQIEQEIIGHLCPGTSGKRDDGTPSHESAELSRRLQLCPAHYLLETPSERIAADLRVVRTRRPDEIHVEAQYDAENKTVEYRVILHEDLAAGCFHKVSGALSAKRLEILTASICTMQDGVIVDAWRVRDDDHAGAIPDFRIEEVATVIRRVLRGETDVETLLKSRGRFAVKATSGPVSDLPLRVVIDNESSDRYTVLDVFAHDRPGLLYAMTRAVYELELSVVQAKIATHFDQVLDIFFVTDNAGRKIQDGTRLTAIRDELLQKLSDFEAVARSETNG